MFYLCLSTGFDWIKDWWLFLPGSKLSKNRDNRTFLIFFNMVRAALFVLLLCFFPMISYSQESVQIRTIVIDAGHGGKDPGALGKTIQEKHITLSVAKKLGTLIQEGLPGVKVIYTRSKDEFIELHQRTSIANKNKADLFVSIHCNANKNKALRGAETYVMGLHRSEANLEAAKLENAAILMEANYSEVYEGFDPNSDESYITFSLFQNTNLEMSMQLAAEIQKEMQERVGLNDRGVRQAGFLVLYRTTMPSVLAEIGYLSNAEEEKFLVSEKGQDYIASAIYRAIRKYKQHAEGSASVDESTTSKKDEIWYAVQVYTSPKDIGTNASRFKGLKDVNVYKHQGSFKYTVGRESSFDAAVALLESVKKKGFGDSFVVAFRNGIRIPAEEAKKELGK